MRHLMTLLAAAVTVLSIAPAYADLGDQLAKLLPDDGTAEDLFGHSVAISDATAIIGTPYDDDNGIDSGSAYLFDIATGRQIAKLLADDGATHHDFGVSVAISGAIAIVGADRDDDNGNASGSAYLFDTASGQQIAKLLPNDGAMNDRFGISVAISGSTAIVGALLNDDNGTNSGSAYLFDISDPKNPVQIAKLLPNDGAANDQFGTSVAISGATALVGAYFDDDNGESSGSAYLFDTTTGLQLSKLLPDDGAEFDQFGASVAISGATAIVGVPFDDDNGSGTGSAYLFDTTTGRQIAKLLPDDGAAFANFGNFGISVAISGATAIVGAYHTDDNGTWSGSAYLFDTAAGQQIAKLLPNDGAEFDTFGISVAINGATVIVGAPWNNDNGDLSGSAYLFDAAVAPGKCPWDLDGSGSVGAADLLSLLASWGPCEGCPADFDHDGAVGASDLLALLANWGPCI
ncbi:MAG: FG-GAP repeat protein [Phycisphaerales bacterium]